MAIKFFSTMYHRYNSLSTALKLFFVLVSFFSCGNDPISSNLPGPLVEIEVSPQYLNLAIDSAYQFVAVGRDEDGTLLPDSTFSWSSSKELVASIDENGLLRAHLLGVTYVRAARNDVTSTPITVLVYEGANSIVISPPEIDIDFGATDTLVAVVVDENGNEISGLALVWRSDNSSVATISNTGIISGASVGNTSVTASLRGVSSDPVAVQVRTILPTINTGEVTEITPRTALVSGYVTQQVGNGYTSEYGVCWSMEAEPTISDSKLLAETSNDAFLLEISLLQPETNYYVRAYATNGRGTGYGSTLSFTTTAYETGTATDIDGNVYQTIKIGDQWWLAENLRVTHYRNGDPISTGYDDVTWGYLSTEGFCVYDDNSSYFATYGYLYNWYVVEDSRNVAPEGWHIPTDEEWMQLESYLGMEQSDVINMGFRGTGEGRKLKSISGWNRDRNGTNSSGFNARPAGERSGGTGIFMGDGRYTKYWSSSLDENLLPMMRYVDGYLTEVSRFFADPCSGFSLRCIMD